jgi:hypothetical protein
MLSVSDTILTCIGICGVFWLFGLVTDLIEAYSTAVHIKTKWGTGSRRKRVEYVYAYRGCGEGKQYIKIGRTNNLESRMRSARTANPKGVEIVMVCAVRNSVQAEGYLHTRFDRYRLRGNEWFVSSQAIRLTLWLLADRKMTRENRWKFSSKFL